MRLNTCSETVSELPIIVKNIMLTVFITVSLSIIMRIECKEWISKSNFNCKAVAEVYIHYTNL